MALLAFLLFPSFNDVSLGLQRVEHCILLDPFGISKVDSEGRMAAQ
jgi:hypothetical protein